MNCILKQHGGRECLLTLTTLSMVYFEKIMAAHKILFETNQLIVSTLRAKGNKNLKPSMNHTFKYYSF